jgi:hypothetical protein
VDNEDPGFTVTPLQDEIGELIGDEELRLFEEFLPDLLQEMLRHSESDAEG